MSDKVEVPFGDSARDTAILLLAAAEDLGLEPYVVETTTDGRFLVPAEVAEKAKKADPAEPDPDPDPEPSAPAKKTAAKKA